MKRGLSACRNIDNPTKQRNVLRFKCMSSCTEQIEDLTVGKKHRFLRFVNNQLRSCIKIFARMLPYKCAVIAFIFDNINN